MNRHERRAFAQRIEAATKRASADEWASLTARLRLFLPELNAYRENEALRTIDRLKETRERLRAAILMSADGMVRRMMAALADVFAGASSDQIQALTATMNATAAQHIERECINAGPWAAVFSGLDGVIEMLSSADEQDGEWDNLFDSLEAV